MPYSDFVIYVDESGDHSLDPIDRDHPVFVLDFCIFQKPRFIQAVGPAVQAFKFAHFGHDSVVLHEHEIRKQKPPLAFLQNRERRQAFMEGLNRIIADADFTIVAAAIAFLRDRHQERSTTHVVVERRGKREDAELEFVFRRVRDGKHVGTGDAGSRDRLR